MLATIQHSVHFCFFPKINYCSIWHENQNKLNKGRQFVHKLTQNIVAIKKNKRKKEKKRKGERQEAKYNINIYIKVEAQT